MDSYSFFSNGYLHGHIPEVNSYDFSQFEFVDCFKHAKVLDLKPVIDERAHNVLTEIYQLIEDRYIRHMFDRYELLEMSMWEGVDELSRTWHNDYIKGKTFNSNILVYLDEGNEENGNFIEVKNQEEEFKIYHKAGDFVWLNQKHIFRHKATHTSGQRRLISYELMIPDLL